jgi:hypothetical protein
MVATVKTRVAAVKTRTLVLAVAALALAGTGITSIPLNSSSAAAPSASS